MKCPNGHGGFFSGYGRVIKSSSPERGTHFCGPCNDWFTVAKKRKISMMRFVLMAALFGGVGAGAVQVDWEGNAESFGEWLDTPNQYTNISDFYYWKQCDRCYNVFAGNTDRNCCESCGSVSLTVNVRARLLGTTGYNPDRANGYQTADGVLYIMHDESLPTKFFIGPDLYTESEAIVARNASLR